MITTTGMISDSLPRTREETAAYQLKERENLFSKTVQRGKIVRQNIYAVRGHKYL